MKKIHIAGLFLAGLLILCSIFIVPKYNALRLANSALKESNEFLDKGDIASGLSRVQHAILMADEQGGLPAGAKDGIRNKLVATALAYPLNSFHILDFITKNGMEPGCPERLAVYASLMKQSVESAKKAANDEIFEALYLAARWSGQCPVDEKNLGDFKKVFTYYKNTAGSGFVRADWMEPAYNGKPIPGDAATAPKVALQQDIIGKVTGAFNALLQKVGLSKAPEKEHKLNVPPIAQTDAKPEAASKAATEPTAKHEAKKEVKVETKTVAKTEAKPEIKTEAKPAAKPVAASPDAEKPKVTPPQIAAPKPVGSATQTVKKAAAPVAPQKQSVFQTIAGLPGAAISKIKGLLHRSPKTEAPAMKKSESASTALGAEIESATSNLKESLAAAGIKVQTASFSGDGRTFWITFNSSNIGKEEIKNELKTILSGTDARISKTGIMPLDLISISIQDAKGKASGKIEIGYSDYQKYKTGKISGSEFRNRWRSY
ncbi:MAG: hypothetical protein WCX65_13910 [bacterium]